MIPYGKHYIDEDDISAVVGLLRKSWLTQGPTIGEFESAIAEYVGVRYAVVVSSGTAALHIACLASGLGSGDLVITSPNTFVASANCAEYVGATPVFADIDPVSLNIDPDGIEKICQKKSAVKAIIPVHFAGLPCDMEKISTISRRFDSYVIEDASHALGAVYPNSQKVGSCCYADMTIFSFHPVKMIAAGEGGLVTTNDEKLYRRLLRLRSHGINKNDDPFHNKDLAFDTDGKANNWYYEMQSLGFNYRMTDIQAVLAMSQLSKLEQFLQRRKQLATQYDQAFASCKQITRFQVADRLRSSNHLYVVGIDFAAIGLTRNRFINLLREVDILTQVHYIPVHYQPYYQCKGFKVGDYPIAESYYQQALSLPLYYSLTDEQQQYVIDNVLSLLQ